MLLLLQHGPVGHASQVEGLFVDCWLAVTTQIVEGLDCISRLTHA